MRGKRRRRTRGSVDWRKVPGVGVHEVTGVTGVAEKVVLAKDGIGRKLDASGHAIEVRPAAAIHADDDVDTKPRGDRTGQEAGRLCASSAGCVRMGILGLPPQHCSASVSAGSLPSLRSRASTPADCRHRPRVDPIANATAERTELLDLRAMSLMRACHTYHRIRRSTRSKFTGPTMTDPI
jgi:hypothetical protein